MEAVLVLLLLLLGVVGILGAIAISWLRQPSTRASPTESEYEEAPLAAAPGARRGVMDRMRAGRLRQRRAAQAAAAAAASATYSDSEEDGSAAGSDEDGDVPRNRKEAKRRERAAAREAERAAREAREARGPSAYEAARRKREEEREAQDRAQEEEIARAAAERQRREDEEAAKWMGMISVEGEGEGGVGGAVDAEALLTAFVEYIMACKMVAIEELATEFKLRSADVLERLRALEAAGRLTGVMDERGKYIYISKEEMEAVANFIRKKGRVAITELASASASFIDLDTHANMASAAKMMPTVSFDDVLAES